MSEDYSDIHTYMHYAATRDSLQSGGSRVRFRKGSLGFFIHLILQPHYGPEVDSASNRNEYQKYFLEDNEDRCIGLSTLPPSCADCPEIWKP